jgi:hypothetical protein
MYRWEHKYTDYNGQEREEVFYFNFSKGELLDLEWRTPGGLEQYMKNIMAMMDGQKLADMFKMLIEKSYGVKSPDGRKFEKSEAIYNDFAQTNAFSQLYMELASNEQKAGDFINGILPKKLVDQVDTLKKNGDAPALNVVADTNA